MIRGACRFTIFAVALVPSVCGQSVSGQAELAVTLHQYLSSSCELVQSATLHGNDKFTSVTVSGSDEEVYSSQLTKDDYLAFPPDASDKLSKLARKSGFRVTSNRSTDDTAPLVVDKSGSGQCPSVQEAMQSAAQEQNQRRHQVQSKVYRFGSDGVVPPVPIFTPEPDPSKPNTEAALASASHKGAKLTYQGIAIVELLVGTDGSVSQVKLVRSAKTELDKKTIEATKARKFEPARKNGMPVPFLMDIELIFRLY